MRRITFLLICCLLLTALSGLTVNAASALPVLNDDGNLLTEAEEHAIFALMQSASERVGMPISVATYASNNSSDTYYGEDFLDDLGCSYREDHVMLIITKRSGTYYYDLYLYGAAEKQISEDEVDVILDTGAVYSNLKSGALLQGVTAFLQVTEVQLTDEETRPNPFLEALPAAFVIALIIGVISCVCVKMRYSMKHKSVDYPLEHYAKMELTERSDLFTGSFVTKRVISSDSDSSGGGRSGGAGGGRGHAGGR